MEKSPSRISCKKQQLYFCIGFIGGSRRLGFHVNVRRCEQMLKMRPKFKTSAPFTETKGLHFQFTKNPYVFLTFLAAWSSRNAWSVRKCCTEALCGHPAGRPPPGRFSGRCSSGPKKASEWSQLAVLMQFSAAVRGGRFQGDFRGGAAVVQKEPQNGQHLCSEALLGRPALRY